MMNPDVLRRRISEIDDGGEFTDLPRAQAFSVIGPPPRSHDIIYTTKVRVTSQLFQAIGNDCSVGMLGRYGLPDDHDIPWIVDFVRGKAVYFLGDCDPFDLLVFAWLRRSIPIEFLGISDAIITTLGVRVDNATTIPLAAEEERALVLLREVLPEFPTLIGPTCAELLSANRKLELEVIVSRATKPLAGVLGLLPKNA